MLGVLCKYGFTDNALISLVSFKVLMVRQQTVGLVQVKYYVHVQRTCSMFRIIGTYSICICKVSQLSLRIMIHTIKDNNLKQNSHQQQCKTHIQVSASPYKRFVLYKKNSLLYMYLCIIQFFCGDTRYDRSPNVGDLSAMKCRTYYYHS